MNPQLDKGLTQLNYYSLQDRTKNILLADRLLVTNSFWQRAAGLMGRKELRQGEGLLLVPCNSIHTLFMRFSIDVLFLSRDFTVMKIVHKMPPWRPASVCRGAFQVVELGAGTVSVAGVAVGDQLAITLS